MSSVSSNVGAPISRVVVYNGHENQVSLYGESGKKHVAMFSALNEMRKAAGKPGWKVLSVSGEQLIKTVREGQFSETLLVIPAGQSSLLDKVFSAAETAFIRDEFFMNGGRGYLTCGSAYWTSAKRIYHGVCAIQTENPEVLEKTSKLALFEGVAEGPLCPFPGDVYKVGFFSDAVRVKSVNEECALYLSGGGSFLPVVDQKGQKVRVIARYLESELLRLKKNDIEKWQNAAIMVAVGKGAALLSMVHVCQDREDIDVDFYEKHFPNSGTNWKAVKERLSPLEERLHFLFHSMLSPLEALDFTTML